MEANFEDIEKLSVLGLRLNIKMDDESFIGDVFYYDENNKMMILKETFHGSEKFNLRFINANEVTSIKVISSKKLEDIDLSTDKIDYETILKEEPKRLAELKKNPVFFKENSKAKVIFKKLSSIHPDAEWEGRCMVFPRIGVKIKPPYTVNDVIGKIKKNSIIMRKLRELNNS